MAEEERIQTLLLRANELVENGSLGEAHQALREASSISPDDAAIKLALDDLRDAEDGKAILKLCEIWLRTRSDDDGEVVLDYLHSHKVAEQWSSAAMNLLMRYSGEEDMADQITGSLLVSLGARKFLAQRMVDAPTITYRSIYERGDDSINALNEILLDRTPWKSEKDRIAAERDVFQLALAQMMRAGEDHPERALRSISRMLAVEASHLMGLVDADGFDIILSQLDVRLPESLRREATIATSKLFELAPDSAESLIAQFVVRRVQKPTADALIVAFSAAAAVFPMAPQAAEHLFLANEFLANLDRLVRKWKSARLEQVALNLLDVACMTKASRDGIQKHCHEWLLDLADNLKDQKKSMQARKILMKLKADQKEDWDQQASSFSRVIVDVFSGPDTPKLKQVLKDALEGIGLCTLKSALVRDKCGNDQALLKALGRASEDPVYMFSALQVLSNVAQYRPRMSTEQKEMQKLQAYAANSQTTPPNPLDDDDHVTQRCQKILKAEIVPSIVKAVPRATHLSAVLAAQIILALSFDKKHRAPLAQQGAVKLLVKLWDAAKSYANVQQTSSTQIPACHAVARILISTDPSLYFTGEARKEQLLPACARMLSQLLAHEPDADSDGPRDWLSVYESLLALTNLASLEDIPVKELIASTNFTRIEDLLLSANHDIRMRAMELLTNLSYTSAVETAFGADSPGARKRMEIVLALTTAAERQTRLAALGALCMMTESSERVATCFVALDKARKMLTRVIAPPVEDLELAEPVGEEEQYRACYLIRTLAQSPSEKLKGFVAEWARGEGVLRACLSQMIGSGNREVQEILRDCVVGRAHISQSDQAFLVEKMSELGVGR